MYILGFNVANFAAKTFHGPGIGYEFPLEFRARGNRVRSISDNVQILDKGVTQQPRDGRAQQDPGSQTEVSGDELPLQRPAGRGEQSPVFRQNSGEEIMEKRVPYWYREALPYHR